MLSFDALSAAMPLPGGLPAELEIAWQQAEDETARAWALLDMAVFFEPNSKWQAIELTERALISARKAGNTGLQIHILQNKAQMLSDAGRNAEALAPLSQALGLALALDTVVERRVLLDVVIVRGNVRACLGDEAGARHDYEFVLADSPRHGYLLGGVLAHINLADLELEAQQPDAALHHLSLARERLNELVRMRAAAGETVRHVGEYWAALSETRCSALLVRARQLLEQHRTETLSDTLNELEQELERGHELAGEAHRYQHHMHWQAHRAELALLRGELDAADAHAEESVRLLHLLGQSSYPAPYLALAQTQAARHHWQAALGSYGQALDMAREGQRHRLTGRILGEMARLYEQLGDLPAALRTTREALAHAHELLYQASNVVTDELPAPQGTPPTSVTPLDWQEKLRLAEQEAQHDPLTALLNRRGMEQELRRLAADPSVKGPACVALLDIDHFKQINDRCSHATGDAVLKVVARLLADAAGPGPLLSRYGGEEFLLVAQVRDAAEAHALLERCRQRVQHHVWTALLGELPLTVSIGYALLTEHNPDAFTATLSRADEHLYAAKQAGRNGIQPPLESAAPAAVCAFKALEDKEQDAGAAGSAGG